MQQLPLSKTAVWVSDGAVYTGPVTDSVCDTQIKLLVFVM